MCVTTRYSDLNQEDPKLEAAIDDTSFYFLICCFKTEATSINSFFVYVNQKLPWGV